MRWNAVCEAMAEQVAALPVIQAIYGATVRMASPQARHVVPALEYRIITDTEMEQWEPIIVQWDQWTVTYEDLVDSERALRQLLHQEAELWLAPNVMVLAKVLDGAELADPDRQGYFGRAVRFQLDAIAGQYVEDDVNS